MRALIMLHRWLGVAFCLLFAMWFASGIVMHFVTFPRLTDAERFTGLRRIDLARVKYGPADALHRSGLGPAARIRLVQRSDGPVYVVSHGTRIVALQAFDLSSAAVTAPTLATAIAAEYARGRGWAGSIPTDASLRDHDQWSIQGDLDAYRPLYAIALNDAEGTHLYVSSVTGEVVQRTTRSERFWNSVGSVPHWLYFTALRGHPALWSKLVWLLSFLALIAALAGAIIGLVRLRGFGLLSPYRGWQALHYWFGLSCGLFVVTWIFSGWLSMDDGLLFSSGTSTPADRAGLAVSASGAWTALPSNEIDRLSADDREVEWFAFGPRIFRRERSAIAQQKLFDIDVSSRASEREFLSSTDIDGAMTKVSRACAAASVIGADDDYPSISIVPHAPIYCVACGATWYQIDGANGAVLEKLDRSRRVYRWLYGGLHTLDFPFLKSRPPLRTGLIVGLCIAGLTFSMTGVVIACHRLRLCRKASVGRF
jgi:hypothetical protein